MRRSDDEEMREISGYGLNAIIGGYKVRLISALLGAQKGNAGDLSKLATLGPALHLLTRVSG